jgi:glycosyltransferase involved in cell wall biosynthesis
MINILFYSPQMVLYGGIERHVCLLAEACAGARHRVTLVTTSNSLNDIDRQKLLKAGVVLYELPVKSGKAPKGVKLLWLTLVSLRLRFTRWNVIYTNGQSGLARIVWLARHRGTRIVHHHHTSASDDEIKGWHPAFRRVLKDTPELVACSQATRRQLESTLPRSDIQFLPYLTPEILQSAGIDDKSYEPDGILNFGFVGRLVSTKGVEEICQLSRQPDLGMIRWHFYGEGGDYRPEYFSKFENVTFHGRYQNLQQYAEILTGLDAMVLLSRHSEGMPLSLIEAMSAGLPWVATDRGGTSELSIAVENCIVITTKATFTEIETRMLEMVHRIRTGKTSRRAQRQVYDRNFSPDVVAGRWLEFFTAGSNSGASR